MTSWRDIMHALAEQYMYWRAAANVFRLHELAFLRRNLVVGETDWALDIACGIGLYSRRLLRPARLIVGMDIAMANIALAHHFRARNVVFYQGNAEHLSHRSASFDVIISVCALEHFADPERALAEMHRILKPGGRLAMTVDSLGNIASPEFIRFHRETCQVVRYFSKAEICACLEQAGFQVDRAVVLLSSRVSASLCVLAFRLLRHPFWFNLYSCLTYPLTVLADWLWPTSKGVIVGVCARKPI